MNHGEIVQVGTPSDIYEYPGSRFVADFIGSVNLFEGRLDRGRAGLRARRLRRARRQSSTSATASAPRRTRRSGSRSGPRRSSSRASARKATATTASRAWSSEVAYRGDQSIYLVKLAGGRQMRVTQPNTLRQGGERPHPLGRPRLAVLGFLEPGGGHAVKPFRLLEALAWIRALGPWRWASRGLRRRGYSGRTLVTGVPYLWLLLFFLVPFLIVLKISVSQMQMAMPPYEPLFTWIRTTGVPAERSTIANYAFLLGGRALPEVVPELDPDGRRSRLSSAC